MLVRSQRARTIRGAEILQRGRVAPATSDTEIAPRSSDRVGLFAALVGPIPIEAPFFDIAVHILQTPRIGRRPAHVEGNHLALAAAGRKPAILDVLVEGGRQFISRGIWRVRACPTGVFPFCFRRKTVEPALPSTQPLTESRRILPRNEHNRLIVGCRIPQLPTPLFVPGVELLELCVGYLRSPKVERPGDPHLVGRTFIPRSLFTAHGEAARLNADHSHAQRVCKILLWGHLCTQERPGHTHHHNHLSQCSHT